MILRFSIFISLTLSGIYSAEYEFNALDPLLDELENALDLPQSTSYEIWDQKVMADRLKPFRDRYIDKRSMFSRAGIYQGKIRF